VPVEGSAGVAGFADSAGVAGAAGVAALGLVWAARAAEPRERAAPARISFEMIILRPFLAHAGCGSIIKRTKRGFRECATVIGQPFAARACPACR
jgi:hypothetical protein